VSAVVSMVADYGRLPPAGLLKCEFDLDRVSGLSPRALDVHLRLYEGYVKETNALLEQLAEYPRAEDLSTGRRLERDGLMRRFSYEYNGVLLHECFFEALGGGRGRPAANGAFNEALDQCFGGFETWKQDVLEIGRTRGIGWIITCRSRSENRLFNTWIDDHTRGLIPGFEPVVVFDLWEHAYLLDFKPDQRGDYLRVLFDNLNWDVVELRCA